MNEKKTLTSSLKKSFFGNRHLGREAIKKSGKPIRKPELIKLDTNTYLIPNELFRLCSSENNHKLAVNKEIAKDLLIELADKIDPSEYQIIFDMVNREIDINIIKIIIRLLDKLYCFDSEINKTIINQKITQEQEMNMLMLRLKIDPITFKDMNRIWKN